ncbi:MAG: long-chain fatty acid--CoA ligase [Armatimonadetes bacterium]|nr:long-chain fatty acid--CoA ligase [Armatimonadota bacterium]MDW8028715.1 long-chain fatty acid--CoA ligase [Armatimonadota bacterium]
MRAKELDEAIFEFMAKGNKKDEKFNELALQIFAYQFERNEPYRSFCLRKGKTPEVISHWSEIPPVPTQAFKLMDLACEPIESAQAIFLSSGTTQGEGKRSKHFIFNLCLYETSVLLWFEPHLLPERKSMPIAVLFPPPHEFPNSSLGHMLSTIVRKWGSSKESEERLSSNWFIQCGKLLAEEMENWLKSAESKGQPVMLLGTSFSFVHFLDWCLQHRLSFRLPEGSRLMDTGGFKGRSREVKRNELYRLYEQVFGIPSEWCINEYGMAELSSQFYDGIVGHSFFATNVGAKQRLYRPPHWVKTRILEPETLEEVNDGEIGLLCHYDLANRGSVMAVLTEDLGIKVGENFILLGRAKGSDLRGCSVLMDELLSEQ